MAMTAEQYNKAMDLLEQFERQVIAPSLLSWDYLVKHVGVSKSTLWRKKEIRDRLYDLREYLKAVDSQADAFDAEKVKNLNSKQKIKRLKITLSEKEDEIAALREQLAYAASVAETKNLDPNEFFKAPKIHKIKANR